MINDRDLFTAIAPADLWRVYATTAGIFRGGGSETSPKLVNANGPRARDFTIIYDPIERAEVVVPSGLKGLSFSSSVDRLQRLPIPGRVWILPRGAELPEGLNFVYRTPDHPLLAVARRMSVVELMVKLAAVAELMRPTDTRIR